MGLLLLARRGAQLIPRHDAPGRSVFRRAETAIASRLCNGALSHVIFLLCTISCGVAHLRAVEALVLFAKSLQLNWRKRLPAISDCIDLLPD